MKRKKPRASGRSGRSGSRLAPTLAFVGAFGVIPALGLAGGAAGRPIAIWSAASGLVGVGIGLVVGRLRERSRWSGPVQSIARDLSAFNAGPDRDWDVNGPPNLAELVGPVRELQGRYLELLRQVDLVDDPSHLSDSGEMGEIGPLDLRMTRSGSFEPPSGVHFEPLSSGEYSTHDMINRLDPRTFRWLDSSLTEQVFLGWNFDQLKEKTYLDVVVVDDRELARQQLRAAVARGEGHGMVYRIANARGEVRAVELNVGARYGTDGKILHLRCHLTDVTAKLRDETELRHRTQELVLANDRLRRMNRELEELKDRYSDLYQDAPAMYLTVDRRGDVAECNETMVRTLGHARSRVVGRPCSGFLPRGPSASLVDRLAAAPASGSVEFGDEWLKADGSSLFVWVTGSAVLGPEGKVRHYRCVAQDITARRTLEAEVERKNERLATANAELSRKNKELDEFTHVVSHDLQEPLRTLIAFSDFLMRDQGHRLDDSGREYVQHLVDASRRLRSLIQDLLSLSRAGKVAGEPSVIRPVELIDRITADFAELIRGRSAEVRVEGPLPEVWGDRDRICQLLANLVGNGLKYNQSPQPRVTIRGSADESGGWATLTVADNGIGIEPKFHAKIFQLFRRLHTREEYEGTGAGLAICQKIVQAHGGRIWVESGPGRGSEFHVRLPGVREGTVSRWAEILHAP